MSYKKSTFIMLFVPLFILVLSFLASQVHARAEFALNFQPNPNTVSSWANTGCNSGRGGMMGGGMMGGIGPGCGSDYFLQEIVNDNGIKYFHVILGDPDVDDFAMEFYIRTGDCCWWGGGGRRGGMMGGGSVPYSSSYGDKNNRLYNAWQPLEGGAALTGSGTGNPGRVYIRQINNDGGMKQEFIKDKESNKPRIVQIIEDGALTSVFDLDMRNGGYDAYTDPVSFINSTTIANVGRFDANVDAPDARITAGRYTYTADNSAGAPFGDSYGTYTYYDDEFDVYNIEWINFCQPEQNPDRQCDFSRGGRGGMMGGGRGGMGGR
ncbi:MAG: hypothetical protein GXP14_13840 [Gammaproteobacteria bacterium]|nr:hypothetical protein [Gammaproteobacteria bacterium]